MISYILYGLWLLFTIFMPDIIYGWSYADLIRLFSDEDVRAETEVLKALNITKENSAQWAGQRIFICLGISAAIFVAIYITLKILNNKGILKNKKPLTKASNNSLNPEENTNSISIDEQEEPLSQEKYTQSVKYLNIEHFPSKIIVNIELFNNFKYYEITSKYEEFSVMIDNLPISSVGIENTKDKKNIITKPQKSTIIKVIFNVKLENTKAQLKILYKGTEIELGKIYKYYKDTLLKN